LGLWMRMKATHFSEMSVTNYQAMWHYAQEHSNLLLSA
jgi:hypothetical protein